LIVENRTSAKVPWFSQSF